MGLLQATLLGILLLHAYAAPSSSPNSIVNLDYGTFQGVEKDTLVKFLGMPFAAPPLGDLRFAPPQDPVAFDGIREATDYGSSCGQQAMSLSEVSALNLPESVAVLFNTTQVPGSEDCLFINVVKPAFTEGHKSLPVVFWIYGGAFEIGDSSLTPGDSVVNRSIELNEPVIYVSANYRLNAFGFIGGKEILEAGAANLGLKDQRFALQWVQKNIHKFGGDPSKVTIWGESAGSLSVGLHLVMNDGHTDGLFRAAVMESGSPIPLKSTNDSNYQMIYDQLVSNTGCSGSTDTLVCLRTVSFDNLQAAVNNTPGFFSYRSLVNSYGPSVDGELITRSPMASVQGGSFAKVPFINGDVDDEGTLFSLTNTNVTTDDEFREYISMLYFPGITNDLLGEIALAYPSNVTLGSPFDTGDNNALTPEFKRLAALQGDFLFQAPRRFFMQKASKTQPVYGFLYKRGKDVPFLGTYHGTDLGGFYGLTTDFTAVDALINFINTMNPNSRKHDNNTQSDTSWPRYTSNEPNLLTFVDPTPSVIITEDNYRAAGMKLLTDIAGQFPAL